MRIGIVGLGHFGEKHCRELIEMNYDVLGIFDIYTDLTIDLADVYSVRAFDTYHDLLSNVDAVFIATPPTTHKDMVIAAAEANVHVYCEKPIALTLEDVDDMVKACDITGVKFMVGHQLYFSYAYQKGVQMIQDGELGHINLIEMNNTWRHNEVKVPVPNSGWRSECSHFLESGIHQVGALNWYASNLHEGEPLRIQSTMQLFPQNSKWERNVFVTIKYRSGVIGILRWGETGGIRNRNLLVHGENGSLYISCDMEIINFTKPNADDLIIETGETLTCEQRARMHFIDAIISDTPLISSGIVARDTLQTTLEILHGKT